MRSSARAPGPRSRPSSIPATPRASCPRRTHLPPFSRAATRTGRTSRKAWRASTWPSRRSGCPPSSTSTPAPDTASGCARPTILRPPAGRPASRNGWRTGASWASSRRQLRLLDRGKLPGGPVGPRDHLLRLRVADHRFPLDVPPDHAAQPLGHVAEVAGDHRIVADLDIGAGPLPGPHAVDEVLDVLQVVLLLARALPGESERLVLPQPLVDPVRLRVDLPPGALQDRK